MAEIKKSAVSLQAMNLLERRSFLKKVGMLMAAPVVDSSLRHFFNEAVGGSAFAQAAALPINLIEITIRDQIDLGQAFVAPGVAASRAGSGTFKAPFQPNAEVSNLFLTADSRILADHVANIAVMDTAQGTAGAIHNHEAGNPVRLPGRMVRNVGQNVGNRQPAWRNDCSDSEASRGGNNEVFSRVPSYDCLHNHHLKSLNIPNLRNGINLKGIGGGLHKIYHYTHNLPGAGLSRYSSSSDLISAFSGSAASVALEPRETRALFELVKYFDQKLVSAQGQADVHLPMIQNANKEVVNLTQTNLSLALTAAEQAFYTNGLPGFGTARQPGYAQRGPTSLPLHFQVGYAHKLIRSGLVRTISLEFDFQDFHDARTGRSDNIMGHWARYFAGCLGKLIAQLKQDGIFDRTLIVMLTADGSLPTQASALDGAQGKNTVVLAGGMIRGGYFGDIRNEGGWRGYIPDLTTGAPGQRYNFGRDQGLNGRHIWRTITKALQIPDALATNFADTADARILPFLLRS